MKVLPSREEQNFCAPQKVGNLTYQERGKAHQEAKAIGIRTRFFCKKRDFALTQNFPKSVFRTTTLLVCDIWHADGLFLFTQAACRVPTVCECGMLRQFSKDSRWKHNVSCKRDASRGN